MAWTGQFTVWAKWAPPLERSKLTSIAGSGKDIYRCHSFLICCIPSCLSFYESHSLRKRGESATEKFNNTRGLKNKKHLYCKDPEAQKQKRPL
jgi:hypothetical protein